MSRYDDTAIDALIWQTIHDSPCPEDFRTYLDHRPENASHRDEALDRLVELDDADAACNDNERRYPAAIAAIEALANAGDATAQFHLGKVQTQGIGVPTGITRGVAWYRLAILQGEARSHINLANLLLEGDATPDNLDEARQLYAKAAELGEPMGSFILGRLAADGRSEENGKPNPVRALELFHAAWDQGDPWGLYLLGRLHYAGVGVPEDYQAAAKCFMQSATRGYAAGQAKLGWCYLRGEGMERDVAEGMIWLRRAIEQGHAEASTTVGYVLRDGIGVTPNAEEAAGWFLDAAEKGDAVGQRELALLYAEGRGLQRDFATARQWMEKAATQGDQEAAEWLDGHVQAVD